MKIIKTLIITTIFNSGLLIVWALFLWPFSALNLLLIPIFFLLPKDPNFTSNLYANILPLLIFPILLLLDLIIFVKHNSNTGQNPIKLFLINFSLSVIAIVTPLILFLGPAVSSEKWLEYSVVNNFKIVGKPTFTWEQTAHPKYFNFIVNIPVRIDTHFNEVRLGGYFDLRFYPSSDASFTDLKDCGLEFYGLKSMQQLPGGKKNPPGKYPLEFEFVFQGDGCKIENFKNFEGKKVELLQTTNNQKIIIDSFMIEDVRLQQYEQRSF